MPEGNALGFDWLRSIARDASSVNWIDIIEQDHHLVFKENRIISGNEMLPVRLKEYCIYFRRNCAYSSVDVYAEIFRHNKHMLLPAFNGTNATVVMDIGACEGYYTLKIKENNPACKVIAVEPNPVVFDVLRTNIRGNGFDDVILVNNAVYSKNGTIGIQFVNEIPAITGVTIDKPWLKPDRIQGVEVQAITLESLFTDHQLRHVDVLKVDTEGSELEILHGGEKCLPYVDRIVVEYHREELRKEVISFLKKNAFNLVYEDVGVFGDLYFIRSNIAE